VSAAGTRLRRRVVENLPLRQHRKRVTFAAPIGSSYAPPQPSHKLPVAADPAAPACHVCAIARRKVFIQFGVAQESGAGVASFQKIVAQMRFAGKAPFECALDCVDVVNALADE